MSPQELAELLPSLGGRFSSLSLHLEGYWYASIHERLEHLPGDRFFRGEGATPEEAMENALEAFKNRGAPPVIRHFTQSGRSAIPPRGELSLSDLGL